LVTVERDAILLGASTSPITDRVDVPEARHGWDVLLHVRIAEL
jgi:hypothetical protein